MRDVQRTVRAATEALRRLRINGELYERIAGVRPAVERVDLGFVRYQVAAVSAQPSYVIPTRDVVEALAGNESDPCERAWELLRENLTRAQKTCLTKHGYFHVKGHLSGWTYRIHGEMRADSMSWNVTRLDKGGKPDKDLCFMAFDDDDEELPPGDIMLAQKIAIETDEMTVFRVANVSEHG